MTRHVAIVFASFLIGVAQAQEGIVWDPDRPLVWDDFQGKVQPWDEHSAYTAYEIKSGYSTNADGQVKFTVECHFLPSSSWADARARTSDILLAHEQLHFDIAEYHTRRLRERLRTVPNNDRLKARFLEAVKAVNTSMRKDQERYDRDSDHGRAAEQQALWQARIQALLKE